MYEISLDRFSQGPDFEDTRCPGECDGTLCLWGCDYGDFHMDMVPEENV